MTERPQPGVSSAYQRGAQRVYGLLCLTYKRTLSRPRVSAPLQGRPCTWTRQAGATWWLTSVLSSTEWGSERYSGSQGLSNAWHHLPAGRLRPALLASWTHACHHFPRRRLLFTAQVASFTGPLLSCVIPPGLQVLPIEQRQQGATVPLGWPTVSLPDSTQEKHCSSQERHAGPPWRVPKPPAACAVMSVACAPPSHTPHVSPGSTRRYLLLQGQAGHLRTCPSVRASPVQVVRQRSRSVRKSVGDAQETWLGPTKRQQRSCDDQTCFLCIPTGSGRSDAQEHSKRKVDSHRPPPNTRLSAPPAPEDSRLVAPAARLSLHLLGHLPFEWQVPGTSLQTSHVVSGDSTQDGHPRTSCLLSALWSLSWGRL